MAATRTAASVCAAWKLTCAEQRERLCNRMEFLLFYSPQDLGYRVCIKSPLIGTCQVACDSSAAHTPLWSCASDHAKAEQGRARFPRRDSR